MKRPDPRLLAVFLLSAAIIAYELVVMRCFAVGSWSNYGSMIISIALLGFGISGTLLTFIQERIRKQADFWLALSALLFLPSLALAHVLAQAVPFNPVLISSQPGQLWYIALYYLIFSVPFVCGAFFIGVAFLAFDTGIHKLYFWNMAGSGAGGFFILGCMYLFPPDTLQLPVLLITFCAALFCLSSLRRLRTLFLVTAVACLAGSAALVLLAGKIRVSEYKSVSYTRKLPEFNLDHYSFSPLGEMHLYSSSYFHSAPGLSDNAGLELEKMPANAFKQLFIDGSGPISIMRKMEVDEEAYIDYLPMSAPYRLLEKPSVLMINLGGGMGIFTALHHGAERVVAVEPNPDLIRLMKDVPVVREFNGFLLSDPRVRVLQVEPRAYAAGTKERFDLVEISLIDAVGISDRGGYPVVENFTYTTEAIGNYMHALAQDGILSITVWNKLTPPRNVVRLLATVVESLQKRGIAAPGRHLFCFQLLLQSATVLVKATPFTEVETAALGDFCRRMSFEVCYYPGMPERPLDFNKILHEYRAMYEPASGETATTKAGVKADENEGGTSLLALMAEYQEADDLALEPGDLYHFTIQWMTSGKARQLYDRYIFDVRPSTDTRPYYTAYLKIPTIPLFMKHLNSIAEEWGYLVLLGTLLQSLLFGLLIIIIPVAGKWKELFNKRKGTLRVIVYYACLGLGYMLVEIFLIQRLVFFLGDPIFSTSLVITTMLVISGLGSLWSHKLAPQRVQVVRIAVAGICIAMLFYIFGLGPVLNLTLGAPFAVKMLIAFVLIALSAFFLGMPFPNGLAALSGARKGLLPWAWGMNGALSVSGSVLARLVSVSFGFTPVLVGAMVLYVVVGLVYKANELKEGEQSA